MFAARYDAGGAFCPRIRYLSGRICCLGALCPRMATVSGRKCPRGARRDTFVPERGIIPGETYPREALCPQMAAVSGRNPPPEGTLSPNGSSYRENSHPPWHLSSTPRQGDLHCWGNFFCGTDAFIEKNSYFWSNFTENILKHFLILMYFTVG